MPTSRLERLLIAIMAFLAIALAAASARADLRIDITRGTVQPMPIAVVDFYGQQPADAFRDRGVIGDDGAGLAKRSKVFARIEAEAADQAEGPQRAAVQRGPVRLAGVFDHREAIPLGNGTNGRHVGGVAGT